MEMPLTESWLRLWCECNPNTWWIKIHAYRNNSEAQSVSPTTAITTQIVRTRMTRSSLIGHIAQIVMRSLVWAGRSSKANHASQGGLVFLHLAPGRYYGGSRFSWFSSLKADCCQSHKSKAARIVPWDIPTPLYSRFGRIPSGIRSRGRHIYNDSNDSNDKIRVLQASLCTYALWRNPTPSLRNLSVTDHASLEPKPGSMDRACQI